MKKHNIVWKIGTHTFRQKRFEICTGDEPKNLMGFADKRSSKHRLLWLNENNTLNQMLETAIHEALHACYGSKLTERQVERGAVDIARFLKRIRVLKKNRRIKLL